MKVVVILLAASLAPACSATDAGSGGPLSGCATDADCQGKACVVGSCVSFAPLSPAWMLEMTPPVSAVSSAATADMTPALTELTTIAPVDPPIIPKFAFDGETPVDVSFTYASSAPAPTTAHVLLSIRPGIPGRPDLTFEVPASYKSGVATLIPVPSSKIGQPGMLTVAPLSGDAAAKVPPRAFPVIVDTSVAIDVKPDLSVRGKLVDPFGYPPADAFVARAFQQGMAVSNGPSVDATDGSFVLLVPSSVAASPFEIDLVPSNPTGANAWFASNPMQLTANVTLPTIQMPAYLTTGNQFRVTVQGDDASAPPVPGALVRALTNIPQPDPAQADLGSARFLRNAVTADDGAANMSLIPGNGVGNLRSYELAVIPPTGSPYATTCLPQQPVGAGGAVGSPANLQPVMLPRRPVFSGTLVSETGAPVADATVNATPGPDPLSACDMTKTRASPGSTLTGDDGRFSLSLDPGTYQIDYDPPAGSAVPRLTDRTGLVITADVDRAVSLPASRVVQGTVVGPDGHTPLPDATIRIFEPRCGSSDDCFGPTRTAPWLIGQAQSDANGRFRAVVPAGAN